MMKKLLLLPVFAFLGACASEWRTADPVTPLTYQAPSYRAANSVGRLSHLAVVAHLYMDADDERLAQPDWTRERDRVLREIRESVGGYLSVTKGYDVRGMDVTALDTGSASLREFGANTKVDGIMVIERWISKPWSTLTAVSNLFLLNAPLIYALSVTSLRISVYEATSGNLVWKREFTGAHTEVNSVLPLHRMFGDMDNAVPPQLRR